MMFKGTLRRYLPGTALCVALSVAALFVEKIESIGFGRVYFETLTLAILLGATVRTVWGLSDQCKMGVHFCGRFLLEVAIVLLGASLSFATIHKAGGKLFATVAGIVIVSLLCSYCIARAMKLPQRMAVLIACGNSICGNSAIAAVAPVIGASSKDVASSIAFTAVLGVIVILALPFSVPLFHLSQTQYGTLAGLTVYAVPQVLAATAPVGLIATQMGTLVKLLRVLMLGPVMIVLTLLARRHHEQKGKTKLPLRNILPWFVIGFIALMCLRSFHLIPENVLPPVLATAHGLTILAMAALGLGVDMHELKRVGSRATAAVTASLILLAAISGVMIYVLGVN